MKTKQFVVIYMYTTIFSFLSAVAILCLIDWYHNVYAAFHLNKQVHEEQANEEVRMLWLVYELVCDLIRRVDRGYGLILLLLLQSFFLHFIMTPYYMLNISEIPSGLSSIGQQVAWFHFHAASVILIVEPCHRVQQEMAKTRSLVSKLMCQTRSYDSLSRSLAAFFKSLSLEQPLIAPLGMSVLERPLLITILGVVSTYVVPRHYFSFPNSTENIFHGTNTSRVANNL
ncbi:uncharacterized protein LOC110998536 [Pieris rapae]|uniref:uncharacterized protein LOC110998536 n=1 Tax=Pieris rapae TaxID=64459 RepID=UPI001E27BE3A|nr:uncharacterized protein LOC110998536 [Pieris rapae]